MSKERKAGLPYEVLGFEPGKVHEQFELARAKVTIDYHNEDGSFMAYTQGSTWPPARYVRKLVLVREGAPAGDPFVFQLDSGVSQYLQHGPRIIADKYHLVGFNLTDGGAVVQDVDGDHVPLRVFGTTLEVSGSDEFKAVVLDYVSFAAGGFRSDMAEGFKVEAGQSPLPACGFDRLGFYIYARGAGWNMTWRKV